MRKAFLALSGILPALENLVMERAVVSIPLSGEPCKDTQLSIIAEATHRKGDRYFRLIH